MKKLCSWSRALLAGVVLTLFTSGSVEAATLTVMSNADFGGSCPGVDCSLRQAIATAGAGDTITFSLPANSAVTLTSGELLISKNLTINGPGANLLTVQRSTAAGVAHSASSTSAATSMSAFPG
jgi:hypothetical protein